MIPYPFPENVNVIYPRISNSVLAPHFQIYGQLFENIYPPLWNPSIMIVSGCSIDIWSEYLKNTLFYASFRNIQNVLFIWSDSQFFMFSLSSLTEPLGNLHQPDFKRYLHEVFGIGTCIPLIKTVRESLLNFCGHGPFQMYVSPPNDKGNNSITKTIPSFNYNNIPAFDVINERSIRLYCHAALNMNLCKFDEIKYISNLLNYCNAHAIKAVVFHVGTNNGIEINAAKQKMFENIVMGIRGYSGRGSNTCKFLLETPAAEGNETLFNDNEFIHFCNQIKQIPDVGPHFGICFDTCHVFSASQCPIGYLTEMSRFINVELVHFNDSKFPFGSRKDRHDEPGMGYIPPEILLSVAKYCLENKIDAVFEN